MLALGKLKGVVDDVRLNANLGAVAWILHRLSGLALVLYLFLHVWTLGAATQGPAAFDARMAVFTSGVFAFLESLIVAVAAFHMFNGLRIILVDFARLTHWQKGMFQAVLAGSVAVMGYTGWVFFERIFG